jgi:hypothetical protein
MTLARRLTIGSSDRGLLRLRWAREGVDDWDKAVSFDAGALTRRSTSSLGVASGSRDDCR